MKNYKMLGSLQFLVMIVLSVFALNLSVSAKTALEFLQESPKPHFQTEHTLLPLSRWGWSMPFDVRVELADHWGYALEFGGYATSNNVAKLMDTNSVEARIVALTASDPDKYPLFVITHRPLTMSAVRDGLPELTWCHDTDGKRFDAPQWKLWSPEAPDEVFIEAAQGTVAPLKQIMEKAPIAIILNGGEYGLSVFGHSGKYWEQDPKVLKAKGEREWFDYISERKAHQEMIITKAVEKACPQRQLYLWYHFGGLPTWDSWQWSHDYKWMRPVSDLPDQSLYYKSFNSGWDGKDDLLTHYLQATAQAIAAGDSLSYNWVCGGWKDGKMSDSARYMGFLKCLYTGGMIGGVAGYFSYPKGGFDGDLGGTLPSWLWQMMHLGRVQALFSQLDDFLHNGDLMPGPGSHRRLPSVPAYEFPTGFQNTRVLVRKLRKKDKWLITAWAADGAERKVSVDIPVLGKVDLLARPCGSVYLAERSEPVPYEPPVIELQLLDKNGMLPSAGK